MRRPPHGTHRDFRDTLTGDLTRSAAGLGLGAGNIQITNSGVIESTSTANRGINLNTSSIANVAAFRLTNNAGAVIQSGDDTIRITATTLNVPTGTFVIDNAGTIRSASGQAIDFDDITTATSITYVNRGDGRDHVQWR